MGQQVETRKINRRLFLKRTGWVAAGLTVAAYTSYPVVHSTLPALPTFDAPNTQDGVLWLQAMADGRVRFFCPRMEMGQGAGVGLSQVVAEELNIDQADIECILPDTDQVPPFQMTVGSQSIAHFFDPVSWGAAQLREALRRLAAKKSDLPADEIKDGRAGFVLPDGTLLGYGALVPDTGVIVGDDQLLPDDALPRLALKSVKNHKAIGQDWRHHELEAIVTGQMTYARDVQVPDMAFGAVIYPPGFEAKLLSADTNKARAIPGIIGVEINKGDDFVGLVAEHPFVLETAIEALNAEWQIDETLDQGQIDARLDVQKFRSDDDFAHTLLSSGDLGTGQRHAKHRVTGRYDTPFAAHAAIEPRSGVVWVKEDKIEVWCSTQDPYFVQNRVAKVLGREAEDVVVHTHRIGGGFGGRVPCQASEAAARLSATFNRPVRVQWDREDEFSNNYFQPKFSHYIEAGVTSDGKISHWDHDFVSSSILTGTVPGLIGKAIDMATPDDGTIRGIVPQYDMTNRRIRYAAVRTPVPINAWRGLGSAPNAFAIESMMDELALKAGIDPFQFRLQNLPPSSDRLANVLREVAEISDWGRPTPPDTGRGLACAVYKDETAAAVVVDIQIDYTARAVRVTRAWCAQDCGLVLNPHQVESQIMGNIIWGSSMSLKEQITIAAGRVDEDNFHMYEPLRHGSSPEVTVSLVVPSNMAPSAVGEAALPPVPAAIANAVFAATGRRNRHLPMTYESTFDETG